MILAALSLAAVTPPAQAADPIGFDIRCMIATEHMREHSDAAHLAPAQSAAAFFFGRVDARLQGAELEERIMRESPNVVGQDLTPILHECGLFMQARGQAMMAVGNRISAREQAQQSH